MSDDANVLERRVLALVFLEYKIPKLEKESTRELNNFRNEALINEIKQIDETLSNTEMFDDSLQIRLETDLIFKKFQYVSALLSLPKSEYSIESWSIIGMMLADRYVFKGLNYHKISLETPLSKIKREDPKHSNDLNIRRAKLFDALLAGLNILANQGKMNLKNYRDRDLLNLIFEFKNDNCEELFDELRDELRVGKYGTAHPETILSSVSNGRKTLKKSKNQNDWDRK